MSRIFHIIRNGNRRSTKRKVQVECPRCGSFDCISRSYDDITNTETVRCNDCGLKFSFEREDCDWDVSKNGFHIPYSLYVCSECGAYLSGPVARGGDCETYICGSCGTENTVCSEPPKDFDRGLNRIRRTNPEILSDPGDVELARAYIEAVYRNDRNAPVGKEFYEGQADVLDAIHRGDARILGDMADVVGGEDYDIIDDDSRHLVDRLRARMGRD